MFSRGVDDRGRPGATVFHGLFVTPRDYRAAGASPFQFEKYLESDWMEDSTIGTAVWTAPENVIEREPSDHARRIASALTKGRRVVIESPAPIDGLAREVWSVLSRPIQSRTSIATWAFANGNQFDLLAVPRLAGVVLDHGYQVDPPEPLSGGSNASVSSSTRSRWLGVLLATVVLLVGSGIGFVMHGLAKHFDVPRVVRRSSHTYAARLVEPGPPDPADYQDDPAERSGAIEAIIALTDRFDIPSEKAIDIGELLQRFARDVRYMGPLLTEAERSALADNAEREARTALERHAHVSHFLTDRPLPAGFRSGPLRWQIATIAWSFRVPDDMRWSASEVAHALFDTLAVGRALDPIELEKRYPALLAYRAFLVRLPRR
jgi:hypothetical protein